MQKRVRPVWGRVKTHYRNTAERWMLSLHNYIDNNNHYTNNQIKKYA